MPIVNSGTTTSAAMTLAQTTAPLTSGTNVAAGSLLVIDLELLQVVSITAPFSSTNPSVLRGFGGTRQATHISGAPVAVLLGGSGLPNSNQVEAEDFSNQTPVKVAFAGGNASGRYRDYAYGTLRALTAGTDTAIVTTTTYIIDVRIERSRLLTGIGILLGSVSTNGSGTVILYDKDGTVRVTSASTATSTAATEQLFPFSSPFFAMGPAQYFIGYQGSSASDKIRTVPSTTSTFELATSVTGGTYGVTPNITPPTTFTTLVGPLAFLY